MFRFYSHILATGTTKLRKPCAHKDSVIEYLKMETGVKDAQLDTKVMEDDDIARFFSEPHVHRTFPFLELSPKLMYKFELDMYLNFLGLSAYEQDTIHQIYRSVHRPSAPMQEALKFWRRHDPSAATYRALVGVTLDAHQVRVALRLCHHIVQDTDRQLKSQKDKGLFTMSTPYT